MGHLYHGYVSHNQRVYQFLSWPDESEDQTERQAMAWCWWDQLVVARPAATDRGSSQKFLLAARSAQRNPQQLDIESIKLIDIW